MSLSPSLAPPSLFDWTVGEVFLLLLVAAHSRTSLTFGPGDFIHVDVRVTQVVRVQQQLRRWFPAEQHISTVRCNACERNILLISCGSLLHECFRWLESRISPRTVWTCFLSWWITSTPHRLSLCHLLPPLCLLPSGRRAFSTSSTGPGA